MKTEMIIFHGAQIPCAQDENGDVFVAIKPICVAIGIDFKAQKERIKKDEVLSGVGGIYPLPSVSGEQDTFCIPLKYLSGWLFSIPTNSVKEDARDVLLAYKRECYNVLHAHFFKQNQTSDKDRQNAARIEWIKAKQAQLAGLKKQKSMIDKAIYETQKQIVECDFDAPPGAGQMQIAFTALLKLPE